MTCKLLKKVTENFVEQAINCMQTPSIIKKQRKSESRSRVNVLYVFVLFVQSVGVQHLFS